MNQLEEFCRQIRARSVEHKRVALLLYNNELPSQVVAVLRQELDSMIRVIYLLTITDKNYRTELIRASVEGRPWTKKDSRKRITDRDMVDIANQLQGWTESVYKFGCGFIHLSNFHDYQQRDPMVAVSPNEKDAILKHMRHYHGGPQVSDPRFSDLIPYLPMVLEKVTAQCGMLCGTFRSGQMLG